jgi:predicted permease
MKNNTVIFFYIVVGILFGFFGSTMLSERSKVNNIATAATTLT